MMPQTSTIQRAARGLHLEGVSLVFIAGRSSSVGFQRAASVIDLNPDLGDDSLSLLLLLQKKKTSLL